MPDVLDHTGRMAHRHAAWVRARPLVAAVVYAVVLSVIGVLFIDKPLALWLKADLDPNVFGFFKVLTNLGFASPWYVLVIGAWVVCAVLAGLALTTTAHEIWRLRARSTLYVLASMVVSGILIHVLKFAVGRLRPRHLFEQGLYEFQPFSGANSFPSGHSQLIWSVMIALWFVYPRYRAAYVAMGLLVSASRVATTVHFLSDTILGSVLAIVVAIMVKTWFERDNRPGVRLV